MSIMIEDAEVEALLADLAATTRRAAPALLLDLLQRERARLAADRETRIASGRAIDEALHQRWSVRAHIDPRPAGEILSFDGDGLPS